MRLSRTLLGLALAAALVSGSALAINHMLPDDARFLPRLGTSTSNFDGVWRSRGYGWVWSIEDGRVNAYEESGDFCMKSPRRAFDVDRSDTQLDSDGAVFRLLDEDDQYRYIFDKIESVPSPCLATPNSDPISVFDAAVKTLDAHYAFFGQRSIDWSQAVETARATVTSKTSDLSLFRTISRLLSGFRDSHVSLEGTVGDDEIEYEPAAQMASRRAAASKPSASPDAAGDWPGYWNPAVVEELLGDTAETALDGEMTYGLIDGDIGYLSIKSMSGYSHREADRATEKALKLFRGAKAVIIDISLNDGGYDMSAKRIAGHFAKDRELAYSKYAGDSKVAVEPQSNYLEPRGDNYFAGPVYVLTSETTVSAAEIFVMAMRALPNVTQIGETTDGSLSDILTKPLPNGWSLSLSNEVYLDSNGAAWEGKGIPPKIAFDVTAKNHASDQDIAAARQLIDTIRSFASEIRPTDGAQDRS
jgi:carboxyl-terminal processing protease